MRPVRPRHAAIANGSFAAVIRAYQNSPQYAALAPSTRRNYAAALKAAEAHDGLGGVSVHTIRPALVQYYLDAFSDMPGRQTVARTAIKSVEKWALVRDLLPYPITTGTYTAKSKGGHEPWTLEQVALAEQNARLDLAQIVTLAVHTGQRGSDIVRMRWSDIDERDGRIGIAVRQKKTGRQLWVPFTAELIAAMATWDKKPPFFLALKPGGQPYTRELLSWHWNHERDNNPLLEPLARNGLVLHGLRATAVVRARRAGATELQIEATYGMSPPMVRRYSRLADRGPEAIATIHLLDRTVTERAKRLLNGE
jgi:integrase